MIYIFDVDGTLTPSRRVIDETFKKFLTEWSRDKRVWLVTGSDRPKTLEQLGEELTNSFERVYQCAGNALYEYGKLTRKNDFELEENVKEYLEQIIENSEWEIKTGKHFEYRQGSVNFSTIGRNCSIEQREAYYAWDLVQKERHSIVKAFNDKFPHLVTSIGGQISMDILPKGKDKSQIVDDIDDDFIFVGDHLFTTGNDFPVLEESIRQGKLNGNLFYQVRDWYHTWNILKYDSNFTQG